MTRKEQKNIFLLKIFIFDDFSDIVKCHWKLNFLKKTIKSSKMKMKTVYIFFALSISYWTYIPKIRVVGQMGWPVENTKIKRKNMKNCPKIDNFQKFKIFILHLFKTNWNTHLFQSTCFYMQRGLSKIEICWVQKWWERLVTTSDIHIHQMSLHQDSEHFPLYWRNIKKGCVGSSSLTFGFSSGANMRVSE